MYSLEVSQTSASRIYEMQIRLITVMNTLLAITSLSNKYDLNICLKHELSMYFMTSSVLFLTINFSKTIIHHCKQRRKAIDDIIEKLVHEDS